jgi:anti-sigma factor RsiW
VADERDPHAEHDPLLIAALLDADAAGFERSVATARVASCPGCAALYTDLLALSTATREVPTPARPREFTLTAADAARLIEARGEPGPQPSRLTGVMTDTHAPSPHASHDTILVASLADHSLATPERQAAEALVADCGECAALHADLVALAAATRTMSTPARPRDYTLTHADAARLRPGGWRRWVAAFGTSRDSFSRPLAIGLTTLGLAGLLLANIPSLSFGSASSAGAGNLSTVGAPIPGGVTDTSGEGAPAAPSAAASSQPIPAYRAQSTPAVVVPGSSGGESWLQPDRAVASPGSVDITSGSSKGADGGSAPTDHTGSGAERVVTEEATGLPTMILVSGALLIAGLALFAIRWTARRYGGD